MDSQREQNPTVFPCREQSVVYREVDGEGVAVNLQENRIYVLNRTANFAWSLADGTRSAKRIAATLAEAFAADSADVSADLERLWAVLSDSNLLALLPNAAQTAAGASSSDQPFQTTHTYMPPAIESELPLEVIAAAQTDPGGTVPPWAPGPPGGGPPGQNP